MGCSVVAAVGCSRRLATLQQRGGSLWNNSPGLPQQQVTPTLPCTHACKHALTHVKTLFNVFHSVFSSQSNEILSFSHIFFRSMTRYATVTNKNRFPLHNLPFLFNKNVYLDVLLHKLKTRRVKDRSMLS